MMVSGLVLKLPDVVVEPDRSDEDDEDQMQDRLDLPQIRVSLWLNALSVFANPWQEVLLSESGRANHKHSFELWVESPSLILHFNNIDKQ